VAFSRLTEIGEQAVAAVAASLARGGPVIRGQLIASRFYEAMQHELKRLCAATDNASNRPRPSPSQHPAPETPQKRPAARRPATQRVIVTGGTSSSTLILNE